MQDQKYDWRDLDLVEEEIEFLEELEELEDSYDGELIYSTHTELLGTGETLDNTDVENVNLDGLGRYLKRVRTHNELVVSRNQDREPIDYGIEVENGDIKPRIVYQHPEGDWITSSNITLGEIDRDRYKVDPGKVPQDD